MTTDLPKIGQILNYVYLFRHEAQSRDEGVKDRPVVVIHVNEARRRVVVLPVTNAGERYPGTIMMPDDVAKAANLRPGAAVLVAEYSVFTWLGFDLRPLANTSGFVIGRLPPGFTAKIVGLAATARAVERD